MSLCVVGSIALDSVETPTEKREIVLGGSSVFFSYAASFFTRVQLAGVVGEDWPQEYTDLLNARGIDTQGLQVVPGGKTFHWRGKYHRNMNDRDTLDLQLNVLADFKPELPAEYRRAKFLFLANGSPKLQMNVLEQCQGAAFVVADTMDFYINTELDALKALLRRIDGLVVNDSEAKLLTGEDNLVLAGNAIRAMGPSFVVVKKGEHGAMFFGKEETYVLPAYPTPNVVDPTGAGDSFAGGMMGYLAQRDAFDAKTLKEALVYGTMTASFTVEDFSLDRLRKIERADLDRRTEEYRRMLSF
jgi:sugar/nucleoside kinase (ribokinase family)